MKLPKFSLRPFIIDGRFTVIPLPKPSLSLLERIRSELERTGFILEGGKFRREKEWISMVPEGAIATNSEPSHMIRMLGGIKWEDFREICGLNPSWNNAYFVRLGDRIKLRPRINLSRKGFYQLLLKGVVPLVYDEVYVMIRLALNSERVGVLSFKTYSADRVKFERKVGKISLYRLEFTRNSLRESIEEIWEDVIKGRPAFLPEPGTYTLFAKIKDLDLKNVFAGLGSWCLSDMNLALPPRQYPSFYRPPKVP